MSAELKSGTVDEQSEAADKQLGALYAQYFELDGSSLKRNEAEVSEEDQRQAIALLAWIEENPDDFSINDKKVLGCIAQELPGLRASVDQIIGDSSGDFG